MNGLTLMAVAIVCLWLGYHFYGRWLEKTWGIDKNAKTPAALRNDGKDYQPASRLSVFAHQFTSITGAGPVTGPIIAAMFGWLPALLWIIIGGVFFDVLKHARRNYGSFHPERKRVADRGEATGALRRKGNGKRKRHAHITRVVHHFAMHMQRLRESDIVERTYGVGGGGGNEGKVNRQYTTFAGKQIS